MRITCGDISVQDCGSIRVFRLSIAGDLRVLTVERVLDGGGGDHDQYPVAYALREMANELDHHTV